MSTRTTKPWGYEERIYLDSDVDVWLMHMKAGEGSSLHVHPRKDKFLTVLSGEAMMFKGDKWEGPFTFASGMQAVPRGTPHRQTATVDTIILEAESPPNKQDIIRLADNYGREGKPYEPYDG